MPRTVAAAVAATLALLFHPVAADAEAPAAGGGSGGGAGGGGGSNSSDTITLDFQDIETRAALQLLADFAGRNLVPAAPCPAA